MNKKLSTAKIIIVFTVSLLAIVIGSCLFYFYPKKSTVVNAKGSNNFHYTTQSVNITATAMTDHSIEIKEHIIVDFNSNAHGIERRIPLSEDYSYDVFDIDAGDDPFDTETENGMLIIKIGDKKRKVSGEMAYTLSYTICYGKDKDDKADHLNLSLWQGWPTDIKRFNASLKMPKSVDWGDATIYGREFNNKINNDGDEVTINAKNLSKDSGLTLEHDQLPEGYWADVPEYLDEVYSDQDMYVKDFDINMSAGRDKVISTKTSISFDFLENCDSVTISYPLDKQKYSIENIRVDDYEFETITETQDSELPFSDDRTLLHIKIKAGKKGWIGDKTLTFSFDQKFKKETDTKADTLDLLLYPYGFTRSTRHSDITLKMPKPVEWDSVSFESDSYYLNNPSGSVDAFFTVEGDGDILNIHGDSIPSTYGLFMRADQLPKGYWSRKISEVYHHRKTAPLPWLILWIICAVTTFILWLFLGRGSSISESRQSRPPEGLPPAVIEYLVYKKLDIKQMMATVLDLAARGYLTITEYAVNQFEFVKAKEMPEDEGWEYERIFLNSLFRENEISPEKNPTPGIVKADVLSEIFRDKVELCCHSIKEEIEKKYGSPIPPVYNFFRILALVILAIISVSTILIADSDRSMTGVNMAFCAAVILLIGVCLFLSAKAITSNTTDFYNLIVIGSSAVCGILLAYKLALVTTVAVGIICGICQMAAIIFSSKIGKMDEAYALIIEKATGFHLFLGAADTDDISDILRTDPGYYFDMLPYAVLFNYRVNWISLFEDHPVPPPPYLEVFKSEEYPDRSISTEWLLNMVNYTVIDVLPKYDETSSFADNNSTNFNNTYSGSDGNSGGGAW